MYELVARGLRTSILAVCVLSIAAPAASGRPAADRPDLESISSESSRYAYLSDALWIMGSSDVPELPETAQAAVRARPDSADAHLRMGLALRLDNPEAVEQIRSEYQTAMTLDPAMPRPYVLMGELLSDQGDVAGVEQNYRALFAVAPNDPTTHLSYALALGRLGKRSEAIVEVDRAQALKPTAAGHLLKAMLLEGGPPEAVFAEVDKALLVGGGEARVYRWRARLHWQRGEMDLALADVTKALAYAPNSFRLRQLRGQINSNAGRFDAAIAEFDTLIALRPGLPDLTNDRCWARAMAGVDLQKALADCDAVLGWDPDRPEALDSRGLVKLRLGDLPGAIADYDVALKQEPEVATSLFGRGVSRLRAGDKAGAAADLDKARTLDPDIDKRFADYGVTP